MLKHILRDFKCKLNHTTGILILEWNNNKCQCEWKNYPTCKKDCSFNPSTYICENEKHLKIIGDDSKSVCDKIIYVMDTVSTKMRYTTVNSVDK